MHQALKVVGVIRLSEQVILADRTWMLVAERRLASYVDDELQGREGSENDLVRRDMETYFEIAGPPPNYAADPLLAEQYHDSAVVWFLSSYGNALARMDVVEPFPNSSRRVIERLRLRAPAH